MSNRFKFRAWHREDRKMLVVVGVSYGVNLDAGYAEVMGVDCAEVTDGRWKFAGDHDADEVILMQSTGLKDKNGVEIYEGDILFHKLQGKRVVYYPFNKYIASFGLECVAHGFKGTLQDADRLYEVIGNINENPELLENK